MNRSIIEWRKRWLERQERDTDVFEAKQSRGNMVAGGTESGRFVLKRNFSVIWEGKRGEEDFFMDAHYGSLSAHFSPPTENVYQRNVNRD